MIETIKFLQTTMVDELLSLVNEEGEKEYTLKAPTGSGKTYMEGYLINQLLKKYPNCIVIYQTLSKANLPTQAFNFITNKFKYDFNLINAQLLSTEHTSEERLTITDQYNTYFLPKQLNIKGGNLEIPLKDFLTYKTRNRQKFLIIDECHEKSNNIMKYKDHFDHIFGFSATPKKEQMMNGRFVELDESVCEEYNLIKRKEEIYKDPNEIDVLRPDNSLDSVKLTKRIRKAINKFKEIQKDYDGTNINPAMAIQISNDFKGLNEIKIVIDELNQHGLLWYFEGAINDKEFAKQINYRNGFASNDKIGLLSGIDAKDKAREYIKQNSSTIPVVIFKLALKEGWDMPRACYLLQIRATKSETLDEQVIGRVRRNPNLQQFDAYSEDLKKKIMVAYIDGVIQQDTRQVYFVRRKNKLEVETTVLKNKCPRQIKDTSHLNLNYDANGKTIFQLKEMWDKLDGQIKNSLIKESKSFTKENWIEYCLNVDTINRESFIETYEGNLKSSGIKPIQIETFYRDDRYKLEVNDWVWEHHDNPNNKTYAFESEAEKEIARDLSEMNLQVWGKNFYNNSKIWYEYFLMQKGNILISKQHPDFIVKNNNKIFLIEVKSYRQSNSTSLDHDDYKKKVESIKKMYLEASKITKNQIYAVVIALDGNDEWRTYWYENGVEKIEWNDDKLRFLNK